MYAESIVQERIAATEKELGFKLEYHSPSEIDTFQEQMERMYAQIYATANAASQSSKEPSQAYQNVLTKALCNPDSPVLTKEQVRFMDDERALCACDAAYFMTRHYWIQNDENNLQRYSFRVAQRVLFDIMAELELQRIAIELMVPKARQLGVTTEDVGLALQKVAFSYSVSGVIASAESDKTEDMADKLFLAYDMMPWWLRPQYTKRVNSSKGILVFGGSKARIRFQSGNQMGGISRGSTPIFYLLTEVASYANAEDLIDAALFKCVHPSPRVLGILESTCEGNTGWWYDTYWYSKRNWPRVRLKTVFLPFYLAPDQYPNSTWLRKNPVPDAWRMHDATRKMIAESKLYIASDEVLQKVLGSQWDMPRDVAWYWECNYLESQAKGKEKLWMQEMPHTDVAAFQGSYDNVFGKEVIAEVWNQRTQPEQVYGIVGQSIEERHEPDSEDVAYDQPRISIPYHSRKGVTYRWEGVPLYWEPTFTDLNSVRDDESHFGKWFVYHPPERGYDYSIGVDTSNGIGSDASAIAVARRARNAMEQDVQVSEWRDNRVSHVEAWAWALAIAAYYARFMAEDEDSHWHEPYVSIEQIASVGDTCQDQMSLHGYRRFHKMIRYDSMPKDQKKSHSKKRGWYTNSWSRPMLCDGFVINVQNGWYVVNSPYTMYEMDQWEVHYTDSGKDKFEHSEDTTDDGLFANALAAFCPNDRRLQSARAIRRFDVKDGETRKGPRLQIGSVKAGLEYVV